MSSFVGPMLWFVYILECADRSLYVGITTDLNDRLERHLKGEGAAHTRKLAPQKVIHRERYSSLANAVAQERQIKGWTRAKKLALASGRLDDLRALSRARSV